MAGSSNNRSEGRPVGAPFFIVVRFSAGLIR